MKPRRLRFRAPAIFGTPLNYGVPVFIGFTVLVTGLRAHGGDILRGGGTPSNKPTAAPIGGAPTPAATDAARAAARDSLARTSRTLGAVRAMQTAARAAAIKGSVNPLVTAPVIPDGLVTGGLVPTTDPTKWTGANAPVQTVENGKTQVTIKQTAQQALLDWQTLNLGKNTTLTFDQKAGGADVGKWIAFNKVTDTSGSPTRILGNIKADGQVYLINSNGVIFGGGSQVNARGLTVSTLPINTNLIASGLLNNPDREFLFDAVKAGLAPDTKIGDVVVEAGAQLTAPTTEAKVGGRIALVGANVVNEGTISTPDGQMILAAGLQVGFSGHDSSDPSLRGLDTYVGAVTDPGSSLSPYAGTVTNLGLIDAPRAAVTLTGKTVNQSGIIDSTTSVSLNGRIDLLANYNALANSAASSTAVPFLFQSAGNVTLGEGSVSRILPEFDSTETTTGTELALRSQVNIQGKTIHFAADSTVLAPNAVMSVRAGSWAYRPSLFTSTFVSSAGQVYLDAGATIDLAGSKDVAASVTQNLITLELRGNELAAAPLQREGELRGDTITVDIGETGTYEGRDWIGTPLADVSGFVGLVQRTVGQLTTAGGSLDISAGGSVVLQNGATIDVSGGSTNFAGGTVRTTQVISGRRIVNIADARPDQVYEGIYTGTGSVVNAKWGVDKQYSHALAPTGAHYRDGYVQGADAGAIRISAPSMVLDGKLTATTVAGPNQIRVSEASSALPKAGSLTLGFHGQDPVTSGFPTNYPSPPKIVFSNSAAQDPAAAFTLDADGNPADLAAERKETVHLAPGLLSSDGFGNLTINNEGGTIEVGEGVRLDAGTGGSIAFTAGNIGINGRIVAAGGSLSFRALNLSPYDVALRSPDDPLPLPNVGRGIFTLGSKGSLSTAGTVTDDRPTGGTLSTAAPNGGKISIAAFTADLKNGSAIDVSGGYAMTATGSGSHGKGGAITIKTGQDLTLPTVLGGTLNLGSTLSGYSGSTAASLSVQALLVQIGGASSRPDMLVLDPGFFNQGGFGDFTVAGLGTPEAAGVPALQVVGGTVIRPIAKSYRVNPGDTLGLDIIEGVVGLRPAVNIRLAAPGVSDAGGVFARGDLVIGEGAIIDTDPGATISVTGNTVTLLGSLHTAGGSITVGGGSNSRTLFGNLTDALTTTYLGSTSSISTAGTILLTPDFYGRRIGRVLAGGSITLEGNIVAASGSVLDVSGTSGTLDIPVANVSPALGSVLRPDSGLTLPPSSLATVSTRVDSDAGSITLRGGQMLFSDATLLGNAGGATARGGSLTVSSGRFYPLGAAALPTDVSLIVRQSGSNAVASGAVGQPAIAEGLAPGRGYFSVDAFTNGGFDSLALRGVVQFSGPVAINARESLGVASGGILFADAAVKLTAPHVTLGRSFQDPLPTAAKTSPFQLDGLPYAVPPTFGAGNLTVDSGLIDIGDLALQGIGKASLVTLGGDIRGDGTITIAGNLELTASQIHPITAGDFKMIAYDYNQGSLQRGSISIHASGTRQLPLSAGGNLGIYASTILQSGVLRAPFGTITLGWDGTGTAPKDLLTGAALSFPVTQNLTLAAGSITSVSAVDPVTGKGLSIPYGINIDGTAWIDPRGVDITAVGPPEKSIVLAGGSVTTEKGSTIDVRGGGDLYAYRWVQGLGGPTDILASTTSFAIIPGYEANHAPVSGFNSSTDATNLIAGEGNGYTNNTLEVGDRIYLNGSASLAAGYYTLLPARYALLPGAVLVSPSADNGSATVERADKSSLVSGFRDNGLNAARTASSLTSRFEVATAAVFKARAEYENYQANVFLSDSATKLNQAVPLLPKDSGAIVFQSSQSMNLLGSVASASIAKGRGASIDISTARDIVITSGAPAGSGVVSLDAAALKAFGAESLLIGGLRKRGEDGTEVLVSTGNLTVDNAGTPLVANDLILVSNGSLILASGAQLQSSGSTSGSSDVLLVSGSGALVRVASNAAASVKRTVGTSSSASTLTIGGNSLLAGGSIVLDSSSATSLTATADLAARAYSINSGRISLQLDGAGSLGADSGLVLSGGALKDLQNGSSLSLLSYSSIDIYGTGTVGTGDLSQLSLSAGSIRGFNQGDGTVSFKAGGILLQNAADVAAAAVAGNSSGTLRFDANDIRLGANDLVIGQYGEVVLNASQSVVGEGEGGFFVGNALTVNTPLFTGASGAKRTVTAGGVLALSGSGAAPSVFPGGLGSSLGLTGKSINVDTTILLPSGSLGLHATAGDLTIKGQLDVSGARQRFYDVTRYTDAGEIQLAADAGNIVLTDGSTVSVAAHEGGGNAGTLRVSTPQGSFVAGGILSGAGGQGGRNGSFGLDVKTLPTLSSLNASLTAASFTGSQAIRVRNGDVTVDGVVKTADFLLSSDLGSITVTGTIDASGDTGGSVRLAANRDVILANGAKVTVAAKDFSSAGKGGEVSLEAGSQNNGVVGMGSVDIRTGSTIDLSVASLVAGDALTSGSSASLGKFSGKLHLRAPQIAGYTDVAVNAINANILGASSVLVEGYRLYDLTSGGGTIASVDRNNVNSDAQAFLGAAGTTTAAYTTMSGRLLANNRGLESIFVLAPGAEIINRTGDLTLGSSAASVANDWDLSGFRYGAKGAAGVLTLRAAGNLNFFSALSDGFTPTLAANNATRLWLARPTAQNTLLPINTQSWSYRLTSGADPSAVDFGQVSALTVLGENAGFLKLGNNRTNTASGIGNNATTSSAIASSTTAASNGYQVIRTGSGDIEIHAGRSVQLLNQFATIYTAGTRVDNPTLDGTFDLPSLNQSGIDSSLGAVQQSNPAAFTMAGGNVLISAALDIEHLTRNSANELIADSQLQLPNNWLYRRGYVDPATGEFGTNRWGESASTTWWVDFTNFFQGVGALGGGDVTMVAGNDIRNVDAVIPTNARTTGYTDATRLQKTTPGNAVFLEIGGGNLAVRAGNDIDAGVYYVERGHGELTAGGDIKTNATRSVLTGGQDGEYTRLPTTLFLGKGGFDISARGDVLMGPVANPFLLPGSLNNSFWQKTWFSTYAGDSHVDVTSLGGDVTIRTGSTAPGQSEGVSDPLLQSWITNKQLLSSISAANAKPWLRLSETKTSPFKTLVSLMPGTLRTTSFSGDINLAGDLTLSPSATGNIGLFASGAINGLQANGLVTVQSAATRAWGTATINLSDAPPLAIPGVGSPFAYQVVAGVNPNAASITNTEVDFLAFIDGLFAEAGGTDSVLGTKQALHAGGILHAGDSDPVRLYAGSGDISGLTLFSPKATRVFAGQDIQDVSFYLQNVSATDTSVVSSGRDIILSGANSPLRIAAKSAGNVVNFDSGPLAGDIQISGPGTLQVLAGNNLDLGTGAGNSDGTGVGITSVGNARNPSLPFGGANLLVSAGTGAATTLATSDLDFGAFIDAYVITEQGQKYLAEVAPGVVFVDQSDEEKARLALEVFYRILRDAGRGHAETGNYETAEAAIKVLFGDTKWAGDILSRGRDIRTANGGNIDIMAPGGGIALASTAIGNPLSPPGIITASGGDISIFANNDISIGIGRIFTLRGGDEILWSSKGDIAAGSSSKTVKSAPPTRVLIDPQSAAVQTDLAGLATGGGIGVLATVAGVKPGDVDLIAPEGTVDAGDAGIRVSGNLNIAASQVLNAANISVNGASAGTPPSVAAAPNVSGLTSASTTSAAATATTTSPGSQANAAPVPVEEALSLISVEVIGYGGGGADEDEDKETPDAG